MKAAYHEIDFNLPEILAEELPYCSAFYEDQGELKQDLKDLFAFPLANAKNMPFYTMTTDEAAKIHRSAEELHDLVLKAVKQLFGESDETIRKFFDCDMIRKHPYFIDYARYTIKDMEHTPVYGRYDLAYDPRKQKVTGAYEFNGDTPVMLFESTNLQSRLCEQVTGGVEDQYNEFWIQAQNYFDRTSLGTKAVVFDSDYIEDTVTCETLAQVMGNAIFADLKELDFDYADRKRPFFVGDTQVDTVFVLAPWEEMVENFPYAFQNWKDWAGQVTLLQPAWFWFTSHKGIWAYITYLCQNHPDWSHIWAMESPILETYLSPDRFIESGRKFVSKPVIGRLSMNIQIHNPDGTVDFESEGSYDDVPRIYQEYCEPGQVEGRNNFILGIWISPNGHRVLGQYITEPQTLCIREFDEPVLGLQNERFIPHYLV